MEACLALLRSSRRLLMRALGAAPPPGPDTSRRAASGRDRAPRPPDAAPPVTWVVVPRYPLTDFLVEALRGLEGIRIIEHPMPRRRWFDGLLRSIDVYLLPGWRRSLYFGADYARQLEAIRPEDTVLYFAIENRKDLQIVRKFVRTPHQHVWLWNAIRSLRGSGLRRRWYLHWLRRSGMRAWTFDPQDVQEGGISLLKQVYRRAALPPAADGPGEPPRRDVYFLGIDKGRVPALRHLEAEFHRAGLTTHFHVIADKRRRYTAADRAWLAPGWLPYTENLRNVARSRALLELVQGGGTGPTIRSLEAAFFDRKLITDNRALRDTGLYHPSRIFILGEDDPSGLKDFLAAPLQPLDPAVLRAHDIVHWIRQFGPFTAPAVPDRRAPPARRPAHPRSGRSPWWARAGTRRRRRSPATASRSARGSRRCR
jgi:hypothetical protein